MHCAMFRFSIRDILWLTIVAALAIGWAVDRTSLAVLAQQAVAEKENLVVQIRTLHNTYRSFMPN
jgi:hypothetical protein